ncbi:MAG: radical SAM protein [Candidatus Methanoperedens sp.]|nr:radical SAM protein [Candidatus Methanoperedens sp.]
MKTDVLLIYPYFHREPGYRKLWLFPPIGLGYLAGILRKNGIKVSILDGTFMKREELIRQAKMLSPGIVGIYCMVTMRDEARRIARELKTLPDKPLLVAGGPLPTSEPGIFLEDFDAVVLGEGEITMLELVQGYFAGDDLSGIKGVALIKDGRIISTSRREYIDNIDSIPHPARDLYENRKYKKYWEMKFGYTCTPVITTRGCPYNCDYCARPVFGNCYRERSYMDVISEIEEVIALGYSRIWFSDDVFTLNKKRIIALCEEIGRRGLVFKWDCLCRVDNVDSELFQVMHKAGCTRVLFGIESGDEKILRAMKKSFTVEGAKKAVIMAKDAGIGVGTFFMVGYPGETEETILRTIRFSSSLPSDYLSYTLPYPLPGTELYKRLEGRLTRNEWKIAGHNLLMFRGDFSQAKLRFAIYKGQVQHRLRKHKLSRMASVFERITDFIFRNLR